MGEDDHECAWKDAALQLSSQVKEQAEVTDRLKAELEALKRHVHGKRSEKMPAMDREVKRGKPTNPEQKRKTRQANAEIRAKALKTETQEVTVPDDATPCPQCTGGTFKDLQSPKSSVIIDYVPGYFRKRVYQRQKLACSCGQHILTAPVPEKVFDKTIYGPSFMAHLVVSKCCDSIPMKQHIVDKIERRSLISGSFSRTIWWAIVSVSLAADRRPASC